MRLTASDSPNGIFGMTPLLNNTRCTNATAHPTVYRTMNKSGPPLNREIGKPEATRSECAYHRQKLRRPDYSS